MKKSFKSRRTKAAKSKKTANRNKAAKFNIEYTDENLSSNGGDALLGALMEHTGLAEMLNSLVLSAIKTVPTYPNYAVLCSMVGATAHGSPNFEAVEQLRNDELFKESFGIASVPSCETTRQRFDQLAEEYGKQVETAIFDSFARLLKKLKVRLKVCAGGFVPLDVDVSVFDNSGTKKEGVSYTYQGVDGYSPNFAYLGELFCINAELREGKQHCQKGTPEFLRETLTRARTITDRRILVRLDSGNDSADNIAVMQQFENVHHLIKRNIRKESKEEHWQRAVENGIELQSDREGKRIFVYEYFTKLKNCAKETRVVTFVTQRTSDAMQQLLLVPEYEVESYYTSLLAATPTEIQTLYHEHATMEQLHSEFKTDLGVERFPSGKFATNSLLLAVDALTYNLLHIIDQQSLQVLDYPPTARPVSRRRIRTVMLNLIKCAVKLVRHAGQQTLKISRSNPWCRTFARIYNAFAP